MKSHKTGIPKSWRPVVVLMRFTNKRSRLGDFVEISNQYLASFG